MKQLLVYLAKLVAILFAVSGIAFLEFLAMGYAVFTIVLFLVFCVVSPILMLGVYTEEMKNEFAPLVNLSSVRIFLVNLPLSAIFWFVIYENINAPLAYTGVTLYSFFLFMLLTLRAILNKEMGKH